MNCVSCVVIFFYL